jgi:uncharacterized protein Yka (UPF0111/DUF47 family)
MSNFRQFCVDNVEAKYILENVEADELLELNEALDEIQVKLDELFGLDKLGKKISDMSKKGDEKVAKGKEAAKEFAETGKKVVKGIAKDTVGKAWDDAKEVAKSHKEIAQATGEKLVKISGQTKEAFKKMFAKIGEASEDQKKTLAELEPLFLKMQDGKTVSGADGLKVLASILSMSPSGEVGSYRNYIKKLEYVRTVPGFSSYKVSIKKI